LVPSAEAAAVEAVEEAAAAEVVEAEEVVVEAK
jgi:hypothetical protein